MFRNNGGKRQVYNQIIIYNCIYIYNNINFLSKIDKCLLSVVLGYANFNKRQRVKTRDIVI